MAGKLRTPAWQTPEEPQALNLAAYNQWRQRMARHKEHLVAVSQITDTNQHERKLFEMERLAAAQKQSREWKKLEQEEQLRNSNKRLVGKICDVARQSEKRQVAMGHQEHVAAHLLKHKPSKRRQEDAIVAGNMALLHRLESIRPAVPSVSDMQKKHCEERARAARITRFRRNDRAAHPHHRALQKPRKLHRPTRDPAGRMYVIADERPLSERFQVEQMALANTPAEGLRNAENPTYDSQSSVLKEVAENLQGDLHQSKAAEESQELVHEETNLESRSRSSSPAYTEISDHSRVSSRPASSWSRSSSSSRKQPLSASESQDVVGAFGVAKEPIMSSSQLESKGQRDSRSSTPRSRSAGSFPAVFHQSAPFEEVAASVCNVGDSRSPGQSDALGATPYTSDLKKSSRNPSPTSSLTKIQATPQDGAAENTFCRSPSSMQSHKLHEDSSQPAQHSERSGSRGLSSRFSSTGELPDLTRGNSHASRSASPAQSGESGQRSSTPMSHAQDSGGSRSASRSPYPARPEGLVPSAQDGSGGSSTSRSPSPAQSDGSGRYGSELAPYLQNAGRSRSASRSPSPVQPRQNRNTSRSQSPAQSDRSRQDGVNSLLHAYESRRSRNVSRSPSPAQCSESEQDGLKPLSHPQRQQISRNGSRSASPARSCTFGSRSATKFSSPVLSDGSGHDGLQLLSNTQSARKSRSFSRSPSPTHSCRNTRSAAQSPSPAMSARSWQIDPTEERRNVSSRSPSQGQSDSSADDGSKPMVSARGRTREVSHDLDRVASNVPSAINDCSDE